jgi:biopolymer transport protein TolR
MGKRNFDKDLNLTPYIDLMSVLITFLLMTAVWNQIEALSTNPSNVTASDSPAPEKKEVALTVTIFEDRIEVAEDKKAQKIPFVSGEIDSDSTARELQRLKLKYPKKSDIILNTDNKIPYRHMIAVFDLLIGNEWADVGVNTL